MRSPKTLLENLPPKKIFRIHQQQYSYIDRDLIRLLQIEWIPVPLKDLHLGAHEIQEVEESPDLGTFEILHFLKVSL